MRPDLERLRVARDRLDERLPNGVKLQPDPPTPIQRVFRGLHKFFNFVLFFVLTITAVALFVKILIEAWRWILAGLLPAGG